MDRPPWQPVSKRSEWMSPRKAHENAAQQCQPAMAVMWRNWKNWWVLRESGTLHYCWGCRQCSCSLKLFSFSALPWLKTLLLALYVRHGTHVHTETCKPMFVAAKQLVWTMLNLRSGWLSGVQDKGSFSPVQQSHWPVCCDSRHLIG